jgi:cation diffusion facilitator family transporter
VKENALSDAVADDLQSGSRTVFAGMLANVALAVIKVASGLLGHSYVLIADGIESTLDIAASLVIWGGLKLAAKPADDTHPYGHGKAEPIAAIVVSLGVIGAAVALAVQSVRKISTAHHPPAAFTLLVLVIVILIKELLYRFVVRVGERTQSTALKADAWHHRSDALTSAAAFIGISIALLGGPRYASADNWAALLACALIASNGLRQFAPAFSEVMDTAPSKEMEAFVRKVASGVPGVVDVEQCRIRKMGLAFYVDLHAGVDADISVRDGHRIAHEVKDALRQSNPSIVDVLVHIEPAGGVGLETIGME